MAKSKVDEDQVAVVMRTFAKGKLRSSSGEKVTSPKQAKAIAMSEGRSAAKHGKKERTWRQRTRMRPK